MTELERLASLGELSDGWLDGGPGGGSAASPDKVPSLAREFPLLRPLQLP